MLGFVLVICLHDSKKIRYCFGISLTVFRMTRLESWIMTNLRKCGKWLKICWWGSTFHIFWGHASDHRGTSRMRTCCNHYMTGLSLLHRKFSLSMMQITVEPWTCMRCAKLCQNRVMFLWFLPSRCLCRSFHVRLGLHNKLVMLFAMHYKLVPCFKCE